MKRWLVFLAGLVGIIILCVLVWFVFPLIAFAGVAPFENLWLRLFLIFLILAVFFAYHGLRYYRQTQAEKAIEASLLEEEEQSSDRVIIAEKMNDAIQTLKSSSRSKGNFLYELPWYIIIGPPGVGKTTALLNSGLKFPLLGQSGKAPVAGTGGTRYCDWWFTEDAVFIDTAGRYTTQDSNTEVDRKSWLSFLDMLGRNRPRQPINGVMVAIGVDGLLSGDQAELAAHATAIRRRLAELHDRLKIDFPVYVLFTKSDLIAGFVEYFGNLDETRRKHVWGATFQTSDKKQNKVGEVGPEFDLLVERLLAEVPDRLQDEADPIARVRLFGLPSQLAAIKPAVVSFLTEIFEPTRYQQNASLRGFYFTSGTQEGTPIDRVLGSMSSAFGMRSGPSPAYSGREKSFFLGDLITKVILGEAGWVTTNAQAVRRARLTRIAAYAAVVLVTVGSLAAWWVSYGANANLVGNTAEAAQRYKDDTQALIAEDPIRDSDFLRILGPLNALRSLPAGYDTASIDPPVMETLGLGQHERLRTSTTAAYRDGLDRLLRSRLVLHLEKRLAGLQNDPGLLYEPLKVYLMLGGDPSIPVDSSLIEGWMQADWETLYPGEPNRLVRQQLLAHLRAMLALNPGTHQIIALNGELVKATQAALLRMSLAERALALLKSTSRSGEVKDWSLAVAAGPDAAAIFETADGAPIDAVRVPSIFTYDGFYKQFLERMQAVIDLLNKERWLLGDGAQKGTVDRQLTQLGPDLLQLYDQEFLTAWSTALNRIKMKSLTTGSPDFPALQIAGGETSPIKAVIESIAAETRLTEPRQAQAAEIDTKAAQDALKVVGGRLGNMAAIGLEAATKATGRGGEVQPALAPGARIQERFRRYHELTSSKGDKTQIDILIENLKGLHQSLVEEQNFEQAAQARQNTLKFLGALNSNASRLEAPFNDLVKTALTEFEAKIVGERVANLKGRMAEQVTRKCLDVIGSRYPFTAKSKRDVPLAEFSRLFGPNGVFDQFFNENLTGLVDTSGKSWEWKKNTKLGQELSAATLQQFQNAARIRDAFFTGQGSAPNVRFALAMVSLSQQAPSATFEVNGVKLESPFGVESRGDFEWPGNSPDGTASVSLPEVAGSSSSLSFTGPWALHRLLNEGSIRQSGNRTIVRFVIGGREVSYQLTFDTLDNPFLLIPQLKFSCPTEL